MLTISQTVAHTLFTSMDIMSRFSLELQEFTHDISTRTIIFSQKES
jgi:hypothetical protein